MSGATRKSRRTAPDAPVRLTPSETSVLALLPTYRTLAGIGEQLGIGRPTVKTHVAHIYEKLGATNRAEAVQLAESAGLLPDLAGHGQLARAGNHAGVAGAAKYTETREF